MTTSIDLQYFNVGLNEKLFYSLDIFLKIEL